MKRRQTCMDFGNDDLPLFSGTPIRQPDPKPMRARCTGKQTTFAACRVCMDTGRVQTRKNHTVYCTCAAGQRAREEDRR